MVSCFKGSFRVTSPRGERYLNGTNEYHKGIDLVGMDDATVYAVSDGKVRTAFQANGAGNYIVVTMADGRRVFYMHLASFLVKNGATVKKGEPIGIMGNTGNSTGAHTHLELRPSGTTSASLDISEFTGIPNIKGVYYYNPNTESKENEKMTSESFDRLIAEHYEKLRSKEPSEWSKEAREFCEKHGIILGDGNGNFAYRSFVTREEIAEIAYRIVTGIVSNFSENNN